MSVWSIANEQLANTRLEGLHPVKQAVYDSDISTEIDRRTCTEGTRTGVLNELKQWMHDSSAAPIYWMNGMAGTGKVTIARTFSEQVAERKLLAASFFFTRSSPESRSGSRIVTTIAYQLAQYSTSFKSVLCEALDQDPDIWTKNLAKQFEKLLKEPLARVKDGLPDNLVVVIDALDECKDRNRVEQIPGMPFRHAPDLPLQFLITSRSEPEIYHRMIQHAQSRVTIHLHDIEKSLVQANIETYLKEELSFMSLSPLQIDQIMNWSGTLFIYAATLVRYIKSSERLHSVDTLYTAVLKSALNKEELKEGETKDVQVVLRTVLCAQELISVETITTLGDIDDLQQVWSALQPLRSVLHQSEQTGPISTFHASFLDLMFNNKRSGSYFCDMVKIAKYCHDGASL